MRFEQIRTASRSQCSAHEVRKTAMLRHTPAGTRLPSAAHCQSIADELDSIAYEKLSLMHLQQLCIDSEVAATLQRARQASARQKCLSQDLRTSSSASWSSSDRSLSSGNCGGEKNVNTDACCTASASLSQPARPCSMRTVSLSVMQCWAPDFFRTTNKKALFDRSTASNSATTCWASALPLKGVTCDA